MSLGEEGDRQIQDVRSAEDLVQAQDAIQEATINTHTVTTNLQTYLPTAIINIYNNKGEKVKCRALLDSGSQSSFMTKRLAVELGLNPEEATITICILGNSLSKQLKKVKATIESRNGQFKQKLTFITTDLITSELPNFTISRNRFNIPKDITLADEGWERYYSLDYLRL